MPDILSQDEIDALLAATAPRENEKDYEKRNRKRTFKNIVDKHKTEHLRINIDRTQLDNILKEELVDIIETVERDRNNLQDMMYGSDRELENEIDRLRGVIHSLLDVMSYLYKETY